MTADTRAVLRDHLQREEGLRLKLYQDTVGVWTIGFGHAIGRIGISRRIAELLLDEDIDRAVGDCDLWWKGWRDLDPVRQEVVLAAVFQLGLGTWMDFRATRRAIVEGRYEDAADHLLNSKWAAQTPSRVKRLAQMMRTGERGVW